MMRVFSIFQSINGEVGRYGIGSMCTFIRMAGCREDCKGSDGVSWCDSPHAKDPNRGKEMSLDEICIAVELLKCKRITITGGEPLEQRTELEELLKMLTVKHSVSVETNGFHRFDANVYPYDCADWVVDIKTNGMTILSHFNEMNLRFTDYIKQVVGNIEEFEQAVTRKVTLQHNGCLATFAFSPVYGKITPNELLKLMKCFGQWDSTLNLQIHKLAEIIEEK
jgi:7-carboxy-7-deazaguanine synthase